MPTSAGASSVRGRRRGSIDLIRRTRQGRNSSVTTLGVQISFRAAFGSAKNVNSTIPRISVKMASRREIGRHFRPWRTCHGRHSAADSREAGTGFSRGKGRHSQVRVGRLGSEDAAAFQPDRGGVPSAGGTLELFSSGVDCAGVDGRASRQRRLSDLWRDVCLGVGGPHDSFHRRSRAPSGMERDLHPLSAGFFSRCGKQWDWTAAN